MPISTRLWRRRTRLAAAILLAVAMLFAGLYAYAGAFGIHVVLRRNMMVWRTVTPDDSRLSPAMRLALRDGALKLLTPLLRSRARCWEMPIALAVVRR